MLDKSRNKKEEERIKTALKQCGYARWTLDKVIQQMANKHKTKEKKKRDTGGKDERNGGHPVYRGCVRKAAAHLLET